MNNQATQTPEDEVKNLQSQNAQLRSALDDLLDQAERDIEEFPKLGEYPAMKSAMDAARAALSQDPKGGRDSG